MPYETLKDSDTLDVVVMGEGEKTMVEIADHLGKDSGFSKMLGELSFRDQKTGNLKSTPQTAFNKGP